MPARPVPARHVVLTFDDAVASHHGFVAPLLKEQDFRATFFVSHRWMEDRTNFMSWEQIGEIHRMGFEIGNHTWTHGDFSHPRGAARLAGELALVENELARVKVPRPVSFAWPGNSFGPESVEVLRKAGYKFARRGGMPEVEYGRVTVGPAFDPKRRHPLLIPTTGDSYPDWTFEHFKKVVAEAVPGRIVVLQFHGVPDVAHPWVHTPPDRFRRYMEYLKQEGFRTLALADVEPFVDLANPPADPVLAYRHRLVPDDKLPLPAEVVATRRNFSLWGPVLKRHRYSPDEVREVTGRTTDTLPGEAASQPVLPYPGGRHTRIGFLEGAINPMRGTKASVFLPWDTASYAVVDVPEAIFSNLGLLFLAHTHLPTIWDLQNRIIENVDWQMTGDGLRSEWTLPNQVSFGASVKSGASGVDMELWLRNGTAAALTGLRTQICVLLKGAAGFAFQSNDNKLLRQPHAGARSEDGRRWILTTWERCGRVWGNPRCPCMHADPVLPDCPPGETVRVAGRLWFYDGGDVEKAIAAARPAARENGPDRRSPRPSGPLSL